MALFVLDRNIVKGELLRRLGEVFPMDTREEGKEHVTYLDTFDWRLQRAGLALTASRIGKQARLRALTDDGRILDSIVPRIPLFASELSPSPLSDLVQPVTRNRRLLPKARGEWTGVLIGVLNEDGKTVVRLRLREGVALPTHGREKVPLPPRLQCISLKGYRSEAKVVRSFIKDRLKSKAGGSTEQEAVFEATGQTPGDYTSSFKLELQPELPAAAAARKIHLSLLATILANREGLTRDWDAEFLHDFRVAVRRTRSALTQLRGVFPEVETEHFIEEFRWLGAKTGPTRDIDVYLLKIPAYRAALSPSARKDLEPLVRLLREKKKVELQRLRRSLRSKRFVRLMKEWTEFLEPSEDQDFDSAPQQARRPVRDVASERILKAFNKVRKRGRKMGRFTPAEDLHRLRIDCKKLRYLLTFFQSLFPPKSIGPLIQELKKLQDHLGDFNDLQVQRENLGSFAEEMMAAKAGPPATLLAMGQLMGQLEGKQEKEREAFHDHFARFARAGNVRKFEKLFGPEPVSGKNRRKEKEGGKEKKK
ncbi:MAG: CHAD domain-containing protein [Gemmatimonadota bacterium]